MKKIIVLLSCLALAIVSCSKSDSPAPANPANLITRIEYSTNPSNGISTTFVTYSGNKISETNSGSGSQANKSVYTYAGDLISKIESYDAGVLNSTTDFVYVNDKLKTEYRFYKEVNYVTNLVENKQSKVEYTYNANGTVTEQSYKFENNVYVARTVTDVFTYSGGNCTKSVQTDTSSYNNGSGTLQTTTYVTTYIYEYDNKVNPFNNIAGLSKINFDDQSSANNVIKSTRSSTSTTNGVPNTSSPATVRNFMLLYNANNLLTESKYDFQYSLNTMPVTYETRQSITKYFYD